MHSKQIPEALEYFIDTSGRVRDKFDEKATPFFDSDRCPKIRIKGNYGLARCFRVARLVLTTFSPKENSEFLSVLYADDSPANICLENLSWTDKQDTPVVDYRQLGPDDYVYLDDFFGFEINTSGMVRRKDTGNVCPQVYDYQGRPKVNIKNNRNQYKTVYVHRLLALTFLAHPVDTYQLVVNHINGDHLDNAVSNLEWATYKRNSQHASSIGLLYKRPVLSYEVGTCTERQHDSISEAAAHVGIPGGQLHAYLDGIKVRNNLPVKGHVFKFADDTRPWTVHVPTPRDYARIPIKIIAKHTKSSVVTYHESLTIAARYHNVPASILRNRLLRGVLTPINGVLFQKDLGYTEVTWPDYPNEVLECFSKTKSTLSFAVKVTNETTNETSFYPTLRSWTEAHNVVDPRYLHRTLQTNNKFRQWVFEFVDLESYAYQDDEA